ncbi:MAG: orotidine-5'-phosphate decarboxylase [Clostridiales bacterium]|nr:orotidine-5'-phosphate decarboxylase [Clostridiales bacterium]
MSFGSMIEKIVAKSNPTVVGLDPTLEMIPRFILDSSLEKHGKGLEAAAEAVLSFNKALIDALYDIVPAVKPQCAYYEMLGWPGVKALKETIDYAKSKDLFVIIDGKRNDIGTTMQAYANAHLGYSDIFGESISAFGGDALTVNGYLGTDGIKPLLTICDEEDKGIFVLCKTSNKSSGELQDKLIDGQSVYSHMGDLCRQWGEDTSSNYGYSAVGAVVGATYPEQLEELRRQLPNTYFLVPGYGAQGGKAQGIAAAFDSNGLGAIVNSSRAIMCAYKNKGFDEKDFALAAREEALRMRDELLAYIAKPQLK